MKGRHFLVALALGALFVQHGGAPPRAWAQEHAQSPAAQTDTAMTEALRLLMAGTQAYRQGRYHEAEPLLQRAVAITQKVLGPENPDVGQTLALLARVYVAEGEYRRAEPLFAHALSMMEKSGAEDDVAVALSDLGVVRCHLGDYTHAEPLLLRALEIDTKRFAPDDPHLASGLSTDLSNLGSLYQQEGDYARAEPLFQRAIALLEKASRKDAGVEADLAIDLNNLATLYLAKKDYARAEPLMLRALAVREKALGPEHPDTASALANLATLYDEKREYVRAVPLLARAVAIDEKTLGPDHPELGTALNNLAVVYQHEGDTARATPLMQRALTILEASLGPEHPSVATTLNSLAAVSWAKGDTAGATELLSRGLDARERYVTRILATGSEEQRMLLLATSSRETDAAVSLSARAGALDPAAHRLGLLAVLRRKGRLLDVMADTVATIREHLTPDDAALLEQLRSIEAEIASGTLARPRAGASADDRRRELHELAEQADVLQHQLAARSAEFRVVTEPVTSEAVQKLVPDGAALVEIVAYLPFDPHGRNQREQWAAAPRYAAYALRTSGAIEYADLGEAAGIDALAASFRAALADPRSDPRPIARELDERVGRPVRTIAGDATHVLLAPDGALNLVPFGALVDEHDQLLIGRYVFTYLTTGRDLLRFAVRSDVPTSPPVIIASPDFGPLDTAAAATNRGADLASAQFPPLPGTAEEGRAIAALLPGAIEIEGGAATKGAVSGLRSPRLLHVATHGFFLADVPRPSPRDDRGLVLDTGAPAAPVAPIGNPLLRSGLVLAGANLHREGDDGVMTALEASAIDLRGTQLVVLSACETGVGQVENGEGVYGLRRALVLAGAESEVMSLWRVDDAATRDLMIAYYGALKNGSGRTAALRDAQLAMSATKDRGHPYYWASFIPSGDWRPLEAVAPASAGVAEVVHRRPGACGCDVVGRGESDEAEIMWASAMVLAAAVERRTRRRARKQRNQAVAR
jgi:CHAT domain-containing protein/Tfp pilus assembly protein PilF